MTGIFEGTREDAIGILTPEDLECEAVGGYRVAVHAAALAVREREDMVRGEFATLGL
jgi:hypothetical protein